MESLITKTGFDTRKIKNLIQYIKGHPELKEKLDRKDFKWCYSYLGNNSPNTIDFVSSLTLLLLQIKELPLTGMTDIPEFFISYYDNPKLVLTSKDLGIINRPVNVSFRSFTCISLDTLFLNVYNLQGYCFQDCVINNLFLNGDIIVLRAQSIEHCTIHKLDIKVNRLDVRQLCLRQTTVDTLHIYADDLNIFQSAWVSVETGFSDCRINNVILEGGLAIKARKYKQQDILKRFFNCNILELR